MTETRGVLGLVLLLLALAPGGSAGAAAQPTPLEWAGVYKIQFDNALVSGERYRSENILEIAEVSSGAAYVRLELEFYNGHQCAIWGIADRVGQTLVYRTASIVSEEPCVLTLRRAGRKVVLSDKDDICQRGTCGARGTYEGISFPISARRPIRYLPRLKASTEYKDAVEAYRTRPRPPG